MKSVLISIQPKWCELIAEGKKTIEVRKTRPKIETPFKCYIYETNWKDNTYWKNKHKGKLGKVIGEFVCNRIDEYFYDQAFDESMGCFINKYGYEITSYELAQTCLSYEEFEKYGNTNALYGWRISALKIYDKAKELGEFRIPDKVYHDAYQNEKGHIVFVDGIIEGNHITRPPQSYMFVESLGEKV